MGLTKQPAADLIDDDETQPTLMSNLKARTIATENYAQLNNTHVNGLQMTPPQTARVLMMRMRTPCSVQALTPRLLAELRSSALVRASSGTTVTRLGLYSRAE